MELYEFYVLLDSLSANRLGFGLSNWIRPL